ncbi:MAG: HAMP domain-containing protein [Saprospiraceae bacterium]|nr:HAMP domain-containing protein [Saprospiraceae bacterium]
MDNPIILHTHTIMALLLLLLVSGMYFYLYNLKSDSQGKKWFQIFYLAQIFWQSSDMIRYSLHPELIGSLGYKLSVVLVTIPALSVLQIAYAQFLYRFLDDTFRKERKVVLILMIIVALIANILNVWNEFYNDSAIEVLHLIGFAHGLLFNLWSMIICFRKALRLRKNKPEAALGNFYQAWAISLFVIPCIIILMYGFYSPIGYWSFFVMIWIGNLVQIVIFINFAAVYVNFQDKLIGFNFVIVMTVLMLLALTLYPPFPPDQIEISLKNQDGLLKFIVVIIFSMVVLRIIFPMILRKSLTMPLQRLLTGVQQVNDGNLNTKVQVGQPDEIGFLTSNFNQMTITIQNAQNELKRYAENLEKQVEERTSEILSQNKHIEKQRDDLQSTLDELKSTQRQLIQSEKMASLGELTAGIAHEIQNPLNFVNNFSEVSNELIVDMVDELDKGDIEEAKAISADIKSNLEKINHHGRRASSIVKGMLEHSRTSSGQKELTDINALCDEYLRLSYHGLRAKDKSFNAAFETNFDPNLPKIEIVPQDIGRVILNLINNAFYAVSEKSKVESQQSGSGYKPTVSITTQQIVNSQQPTANSQLLIAIKDNGSGIPSQIKDKIFQPFFTTKPTGQGTGLGLSLAYDIVKAHGGEMKVESKEGEGSEFLLYLPI